MRTLLFVTGMLAAAGAMSTGAQAQNYPWCAQYGGQNGGASNCGFTTFEQCMATLSGMGGFCDRNTQYVPPPGPHRPGADRPRRRKFHRHS
jgi:hypothetical protein